jgi:hypothetical protein
MRLRFALLIPLLATPALANSLETFLAAKGGNSCWERSYDAAHLKANPRQLVTSVRLSAEVQDGGAIHADIGFNLRKRTGQSGPFDYAAGSYCAAKGAAIACPSEWDAGIFTIERSGDGILVKHSGMIVNPSNYDSEDIADTAIDLSKSDDASFLLRRAQEEGCSVY